MASQIENHRSGAEVVNGDAICRKRSIELLGELGLPKGLLPLEDIEEFGYNRDTGFMWLVQKKKKIEHTFKKIKQTVSYAREVTAFVEKGKLKKITGVKTKELLLWLSVVEVYLADASPEKVTFKTGTGLSDTFDAAAFALGDKLQVFQSPVANPKPLRISLFDVLIVLEPLCQIRLHPNTNVEEFIHSKTLIKPVFIDHSNLRLGRERLFFSRNTRLILSHGGSRNICSLDRSSSQ
ncbi:Os07g0118200 [Oryza sativa Japonica Group]|uniref:Os07g0118200 protein n=1 Tax=Oryza sativa subsp. japonica TaxID=39947 RepID=Q0D8Z5_ORYSJ|nr:Os07g0118200 [Oryza sativa Japonica Group]|eukprot:NP_001058764.2 Os07g0118200 [Oryza sativa Japonica Group]